VWEASDCAALRATCRVKHPVGAGCLYVYVCVTHFVRALHSSDVGGVDRGHEAPSRAAQHLPKGTSTDKEGVGEEDEEIDYDIT
jgi:hypothetical protein